MNVDLLIKENKELSEEKQRYKEMWFSANDLLSKYRDLEEQLGCPLMTVFKALQNGVYYEDVTNCMKYMAVDLHLNLEGEYVLYFSNEEYLLTKNYKKTWWLKKDRSE